MANIVSFGMSFRRFVLFMIKKKYLDLDLSDVDLTKMEDHDVSDPIDKSMQLEGQGAEKTFLKEAEANLLVKVDMEIQVGAGDDRFLIL